MRIRSAHPPILLGAAVLAVLYMISLSNYLLFHSLAEVFSIVIAFSIFIIAWNARRWMENTYLLFLGISYLFIGGLDLLHTLAYTGMGVFPWATTDLPTQIWISTRYVESLSLLLAPVFLGRRMKANFVLVGYIAASALIIASLFYWGNFPECFVEGRGLTGFKKISEYVISGILLASIIALVRKRDYFHPGVLRFLVASVVLTIASELAFTFYAHAYGFANLVGHYFKIVSFYLIYKALIETGLRQPYDLLFRELLQREEAIRESERKFRALAENAPDIIASLDCNLRFLYVNPAVRLLTRRAPSELIGKTPGQAGMQPEFCDVLAGVGRAVCDSARVETAEVELHDSGGKRCYRMTVVPEMSEDGVVKQILAVASDITELKEAEEITRRDKETLEQLVAQRSEELMEAHRKLAEAKRLSDIGTLAATVAHELRNPLGVIQAALCNIRRKSENAALDRHLGNIEKKISESNLIISNLLRYSRIRRPRLERVNLFDLVRESLESAASRFPDQKAAVVTDTEPIREQAVEVDVVQIKEVLDNILNNAYQAISDSGGRIEVAGRIEPGQAVLLSVKDNGAGIAREDLERIFEPFFTKKSRGTGLGLTICRELVKLHGGTVLVASEQGLGTTVTVSLPLLEPDA
jgi:PAS domain S-box-containing protein